MGFLQSPTLCRTVHLLLLHFLWSVAPEKLWYWIDTYRCRLFRLWISRTIYCKSNFQRLPVLRRIEQLTEVQKIQTANQGLSPYTWQTATNSINLVSALIAACLYGNIGIKVVYQNILRELFGFPALETKNGKLLWIALVPIYWSVAFIVCSAIPNITNFSSLIAAVCILQFSYTFPPIMMLALDVQRDAMLPEETFNPTTGEVNRVDSGWTRIKRGFFARRVPLKLWYILFALGSFTVAVLGTYSSVKGLTSAFRSNPNVASFGCSAPIWMMEFGMCGKFWGWGLHGSLWSR